MSNEVEENDEEIIYQENNKENEDKNMKLSPKWPNRVFAVELLRKIIAHCHETNDALRDCHFDLLKAKRSLRQNETYLIFHLTDLMQVACISLSSPSDQLKLAGLKLLEDLIKFFSNSKDPEFEDHYLLELSQAQVEAALRDLFKGNVSSYVVAKACKVCSSWICSGVTKNSNDLKRFYKLLQTPLIRLENSKLIKSTFSSSYTNASLSFINTSNAFLTKKTIDTNDQFIFSELCFTLENLALLRAWAEVIFCLKLYVNLSKS